MLSNSILNIGIVLIRSVIRRSISRQIVFQFNTIEK